MTTEQNSPEAAAPQQGPPAIGQSQGQPQGHRRRRRRKGGSNAAKAQAQQQTPNQAAAPPAAQPAPQSNGQNSGQQPQKQKSSNQGRFFHKNGQQGNGQSNNQGGQYRSQANGNPGNSQSNPGNSQSNNQGGSRRKSKTRRQQVFVGPMDHSYRVVNGNMADAPPSTMEYRSNVNGNGNGYFTEPVHIHPPAPVAAVDGPTRIYCFIEDLFFLAKIQETARKLGVKVGFVKGDKESVAKITEAPEEERPSLILVDLNNAGAKPLTLIPKLKSKLKRGTSVIGFLSHLQGDLKVKALEAGCDMVMPRSAFSQNLPNLLRRHGLDEELEAIEA